ncbi:hypothetical protein RHMOL_Rhmol03G0227800 [Rhododendron molle]|uniref:Uncharacterized protein n=1 Tax=Rhododendron molle TaxID=49168 RepID=A0ACC0PHM6_RHOML|nr:hypothetical protein RHMOL_Rhmol03G0227800 [Rhododendron molle]
MITCLGGNGREVRVGLKSSIRYAPPQVISCRKMFNVSSVPSEVFDQTADLQLKWLQLVCGECEVKGKFCRFKIVKSNSTGDEIECFGDLNPLTKELRSRQDTLMHADIKKITNQFKDKVGQGGYGTVYKGQLSYDVHVAVKILNNTKDNGEEFINEVGIIGTIHHINVVRLVGYCAEGFRRALIYEFLPNDSLEKFASSDHKKRSLGWKKLLEIAMGIAKGIEYLHQGCDQQILHFDIKPHNILLDDNLNPKISDFGQAKLCSKEQSVVSMMTARGTIGYIAPKVFSRNFGNVSHKSDIYSFGMLLLEVVGGKKNFDVMVSSTNQVYFPEWIYNCLEKGEELGIHIQDEGDAKIAKKLAIVRLWCIQWYPVDRPSMHVVIQILEGDGDTLIKPPNPFASTNPTMTTGQASGRPFNSELVVIVESE